jgi:hypothetical protein
MTELRFFPMEIMIQRSNTISEFIIGFEANTMHKVPTRKKQRTMAMLQA